MTREKLVRDKIPEIIREQGTSPTVRLASSAEVDSLLRQKLVEEAEEFLVSGRVEEIADIIEVIHTILKQRNISHDYVEQIRQAKRQRRGGFERFYVLMMNEN